jgi:homocysteine S-methyltransferase
MNRMTTNPLPDTGTMLLTDGGLETVLVFHDGTDLPAFAAFPLLDTSTGRDRLLRYFTDFTALAAAGGFGFVFETPTWRANPAWGPQLGYSAADLRPVADAAVALGHDVRAGWSGTAPFLVSGCVGPRGDGYVPGETMAAGEAAEHHRAQVGDLVAAGVDLVTALTLSYVDEAVGVVAAAAQQGVPSVVGFTLETDGRLPDGTPLGEAVEAVDAATGSAAAWFTLNCAHPDHVALALPEAPAAWMSRIGGLRPNASRMSHAELDTAEHLDDGDPAEFGPLTVDLARRLGSVRVLGGCCGTDARHVASIGTALSGSPVG